MKNIRIRAVHNNNLNRDLQQQLIVVFTGVSGTGKTLLVEFSVGVVSHPRRMSGNWDANAASQLVVGCRLWAEPV